MENSERELIENYFDGDTDSLTYLINRYLKQVYNFSYYLCGEVSAAEDVTQDSFLKMWKNLKKYDHNQNFKTWLFTIVRNTSIDYLRKRKIAVFSDFDDEFGENFLENNLTDLESLPNEVFEKAENKKLVESLLKGLPIEQREVLLLHYMEGMTFEEISEMSKKSINTVKSQHRRTLIYLKEKLLNAPKG